MNTYIKTYGIACVEEIDGQREIIASVNDVTADSQKADRLVDLFNKHRLSPEHLKNAIEDSLDVI